MAASARDREIGQSQPLNAKTGAATQADALAVCFLRAGSGPQGGKPNAKGVVWLDWPCGQNPGRSPKATNARWRARR